VYAKQQLVNQRKNKNRNDKHSICSKMALTDARIAIDRLLHHRVLQPTTTTDATIIFFFKKKTLNRNRTKKKKKKKKKCFGHTRSFIDVLFCSKYTTNGRPNIVRFVRAVGACGFSVQIIIIMTKTHVVTSLLPPFDDVLRASIEGQNEGFRNNLI
jgi:hypothetical protein